MLWALPLRFPHYILHDIIRIYRTRPIKHSIYPQNVFPALVAGSLTECLLHLAATLIKAPQRVRGTQLVDKIIFFNILLLVKCFIGRVL